MPLVRRGGTSLIEVLAAVLIMGVGVLGVMTLFPISILRSLQATQLTNATIIAKRADAITDMFRLVTDDYIPQPEEGHETHAVIDPFGWHDLAASDPAIALQYGNDGTGPVQYPPRIVQGELVRPRFVGGTRDILGGNVINPVGGTTQGVPLRRLNFAVNPFGNNSGGGPGPNGPYPALANPIFSPALTIANRDAILAAVGLPDNFDTAFAAEPAAPQTTATKVGFPAATFDLSNLVTASLIPGSRVTLFDITGKRSQVRNYPSDGVAIGLNGANWEITWTDPLPADFVTISEVRVEFPVARYTWMLTVRKTGIAGGSVTHIDCVAFFRRPTGDISQEQVYVADQPSFDPGRPNTPPTDTVLLSYPSGGKPAVKKGGWVFDPQHCRWYRIIDIDEDSETPTSVPLQLDRRAEKWIRNLIVPEGVISVFPLPTRVDQTRLDSAR